MPPDETVSWSRPGTGSQKSDTTPGPHRREFPTGTDASGLSFALEMHCSSSQCSLRLQESIIAVLYHVG